MNNDLKQMFDKLADFFSIDQIEWLATSTNQKAEAARSKDQKAKPTKALFAPFLDARAIMDRFDDVVGPENWRNEFLPGPAGGVMCGISIRVNDQWITKWDGAENTQVSDVKGGFTSAFKRAAVLWGVGRYLYSVTMHWVDIDRYGRPVEPLKLPSEFLPKGSVNVRSRVAGQEGQALSENKSAEGKKPADESTDKSSDNGTQTTGARKGRKPPVEPEAKTAEAEVKVPEPAGTGLSGDPVLDLAWARAVTIPADMEIPMAGKTLGEVEKDKNFAAPILTFFAGKSARKSGEMFLPKTDHEKDLETASKLVLTVLESNGKSKKKA